MARISVRVTGEAAEIRRAIAEAANGAADADGAAGAVVTFTGLCRDEGGRLAALELEHYPGMAEREIGRVGEMAAARFAITSATVVHRHGLVLPGEPIVLVATAAPHRRAAFEAAEFIMDFLKTSAPFWKKEHLKGDDAGGWVAAKASDVAAGQRWGGGKAEPSGG